MIVTIIIFVCVLGILIFVHEFGHFIAAKKSGITVHEFGFGFPPRIFGIQKGGTLYSLNWIPIGGFVKIKGETGPATGERDSFSSLSAFRRVVILLAGVTMNVALAAFLLSFSYAVGAPTAIDEGLPSGARVRDPGIQILSVAPNSPAERVGLVAGDRILQIDGLPMTNVEEVQSYNETRNNVEEVIVIDHEKDIRTLRITPTILDVSDGRAVWGVSLARVGYVSFPWYQSIWLGIRQSFWMLWNILLAFGMIIRELFIHQKVPSDIAGPIGIAALTSEARNLGMIYLVQFTALLSLNLALVNALPIPALDGGRVLFVIIEKISRKKVDAKVEAIIHNIGYALLLVLILAVTVRDVSKYAGGIMTFVTNLFGRAGS